MRKLLTTLLVLTLFALTVVPVGAQEMTEVNCFTDEEANVVLIGGAVANENEIIREGAAAFMEECPNITVEVIEGPESATDRLGLYLQNFEATSPDIDIYQIDVIWPGILYEHLVDMKEYMTEEQLEAHFPAIVDNNTVDGRLVGIPWFTDAGVLYYRTDLLEKYELDVPGTWAELQEAAQTIQDGERSTEGNEDFWGFVWQGDAYEGLTCDALEWQYSEGGGVIVNSDREVEVNNEATIRAMSRAADWVGTISPEGVTGYQEEDARAVWHAGNAAFMRNWPYAYSISLESDVIGEYVGVAALPAGEMGRAATLGGWQLAVSKYSENPDAAAAVAVYLTGYEEQKRRAIEGSFNPTIMALYEDEEVLEAVPFFGSLYDVFINAVARPSTVTGELYNEVSTLYFTAVHNILTGEADAEEALLLLELDLQELLAE